MLSTTNEIIKNDVEDVEDLNESNKNINLIQKKEEKKNPINAENMKYEEYEEYELEPTNLYKNENNIIVLYDEQNEKYTFYNSNKSILGSFNIKQLIKYIGKQIEPNFYNIVDAGYSEDLIKSMIGEIGRAHV
jgi:hypothetical protein